LQDPAGAHGQQPGVALQAQTWAQCLPVGNEAGIELSHGAARSSRADPSEALPPLTGRANAVLVASGEHANDESMGPGTLYVRFRHSGGLALAGLLRNLARDRRMAVAGGQVSWKESNGALAPGRRGKRRHAGPRHAGPRSSDHASDADRARHLQAS